MPVGAAIGAVGSLAGGLASGKGASSAAKIQAQAQAQQTAALQQMYQQNVAMAQPTMQNGNLAQTQLNALAGLGGDPTAALKTLEATPGYQFQLQQGLAAKNANAYASGMGNSGAALKSAMDYGSGLAQQNYGNYFNQLGSIADRGVNAEAAIAGQGNTTTNALNQVSQNGANAASGNAAYQGNNIANVLKGLTQAGTQAFGSSYTNTAVPSSSTFTLADPLASPLSPAFNSAGLNTNYFGR